MSKPLTIYVLGPSASGKTSLLQQLRWMCDNSALASRPMHETSTKGQEIHSLSVHSLQDKGNSCIVELHELGGEMTPMWEKFIQSRLQSMNMKNEKSQRFALMFVVDALSPHLLPLVSVMFSRLKSSGGISEEWPAVVLLSKVASRNAMTEKELDFFLPSVNCEKPKIFCIDSWNGIGLGDVMNWIRRVAFSC